ncbi:MAG: FAD-binding protein [Methylocella sp.]
MTALVLAEHDGRVLKPATLNAVAAALLLGGPVELLVVGHGVRAIAEAGSAIAGVEKVLLADDPLYAHPLAETVAPLVTGLAGNYAAILAAATTFGKNVLPRVAATLDAQQISEIVEVVAPDTFVRPIYAGNALATVRSKDALKVITVRATAFAPAAASGGAAPIAEVAPAPAAADAKFLREELAVSERPELTAARIVISGGRGLQNAENFATYIEPVAQKLGAAMGASRAAVDAGYAPNDWQVGRPARSSRPIFTSRSAFQARSSTSPG